MTHTLEHFVQDIVQFVPLIPLAVFVIILLIFMSEFLRASPEERAETSYFTAKLYYGAGIIGMGIAWLITVISSVLYFFVIDEQPVLQHSIFEWISIKWLVVEFGILIDTLSMLMMLVVTSVSLGVQIYSISYMKHDEEFEKGFPRYMAILNLFTFGMLILTLSSNWVTLFIGWEVMGFCSFLLIGFWFTVEKNAIAAKKAFLYTKVGDVMLLAGFILLVNEIRTAAGDQVTEQVSFDFIVMRELLHDNIGEIAQWKLAMIVIFIFIGVVGKSAQFPLFGWLPDAMAGPTTVSTLIHSATMVKAGIYLLLRTFWTFYDVHDGHLEAISPSVSTTIAWIGGITAFLAGTMALYTPDMKRVLAFSTVSQLAYMVMGLGAGGLAAGLMHVISHATFKATLFLAAGAVYHAVHTYDMRQMGGLHELMPWTSRISLVAILALAGMPLTSGFISKDALLYTVMTTENVYLNLPLFALGLATALLTAFYSFRWYYLIFRNYPRSDEMYAAEDPEKPMLIVLIALMVAIVLESIAFDISLILDMINGHGFEGFLSEKLSYSILGVKVHEELNNTLVIIGVLASVIVGTGAVAWSYRIYSRDAVPGEKWQYDRWYPTMGKVLTTNYLTDGLIKSFGWFVHNKISAFMEWIDARFIDHWVIDTIIRDKIGIDGSKYANEFDMQVVDGVVRQVYPGLIYSGKQIKRIQTGFVGNYILYMVAALVLLLAYVAFYIFFSN